jgi:hypothetical protein
MLPTNLQFQNKKEKYTTVEVGIPVNEGRNGKFLYPAYGFCGVFF